MTLQRNVGRNAWVCFRHRSAVPRPEPYTDSSQETERSATMSREHRPPLAGNRVRAVSDARISTVADRRERHPNPALKCRATDRSRRGAAAVCGLVKNDPYEGTGTRGPEPHCRETRHPTVLSGGQHCGKAASRRRFCKGDFGYPPIARFPSSSQRASSRRT
jgi:hypothetical protein